MNGLPGEHGAVAPEHAVEVSRHVRVYAEEDLAVKDLVPNLNDATLTNALSKV